MALSKAEKERRAAERAALREEGAPEDLEARADVSSDREQADPAEDAPADAEDAPEAPSDESADDVAVDPRVMASRSVADHLTKTAEGDNAWVYVGDEDLIQQEIGGNVYDFRKGYPVTLPPGQSPTHDEIIEVS